MMTEAEPPASSRLRRRSFFENMETGGGTSSSSSGGGDGSQLDAVSLDLAPANGGGATGGATGGGGGSAVFPLLSDAEGASGAPSAESDASSPSTPVSTSSAPGRSLASASAATARDLLRRVRAFLAVQLQLWRLQLLSRFPLLARGVAACELQYARCRAVGAWLFRRRRAGSDPAGSPVKHWAYPTHWLTLASVSLVAAQLATYWYFQTLPMDLRVDECVFRERLLASSYATNDYTYAAASPPASGAALRFLERRFEQQYGFQALQQRSRQRLPWTCMAIVPTSAGRSAEELALARQLAFFWPRAEVVDPRAPVQRASRFQVVLGSSPAVAHTGGEHAGVVAALFPLETFRRDLFPRRFPDLVLVKTEFALRQMLKFRDERAEERAAGQDALPRVDDDAQHEDDALSWSQFGVYLLKTTVPDVYDRRVRKDWDAFLHVVVRSEQDKKEQFTEELLALWLAHPLWPTLHVRFANSAALCGSFQLLLSSLTAQREAEAAAEAAEEEDQGEEGFDGPDRWEDDDDYDWDALDGRAATTTTLNKQQEKKAAAREPNIDLVCDAEANSPQEIARLKNAVGLHVFPVPPEVEAYEELALESLAAGAVVLTYDTPVMQEWVPDACGVRVGSFEVVAPTAAGELLSWGERVAIPAELAGEEGGAMLDGGGSTADDDAAARGRTTGTATGEMRLPVVHVASSDIEQGVARLLALDRVNRVAAGRAARAQYLSLRTHYLSAVAALDVAICDDDGGDAEGGELPSEIGAHSRRKVEVETLRTFLY